jgi:hypothetical protein
VTDRARVNSLPDETPVEELPLPRSTINKLFGGDVLTLGQLRTMSDADLLRLRRLGHGTLAEVRALVPAVAALSGQVTVAGRTFTLGAVYAPKRVRGHRKPRRPSGGFYAKCDRCEGEVRAGRSGPPGAPGRPHAACDSRGSAAGCR